MSDYANHIDYRLNEITGDRRTLIEVSKLHGIPYALTLRRCRDRQAGGMTTKLLLCTQCEVNLTAAAVCADMVTRRREHHTRICFRSHSLWNNWNCSCQKHFVYTSSTVTHAKQSATTPLVQTQCRLTALHSVHILHINLMEYHS